MADRGQPIDPARLKKMAETLKKQIGRADEILKNMNRFAHSSDEAVAEVDLNQTLELFMALTERFRTMRGVEADLQLPANPLIIATAPFFLMNLLLLCLDLSMSAGGEGKKIDLVVEATENSVHIRFRQLSGLTEEFLETFPSDREKNLLALLNADLTAEPASAEISLRLPKKME